MFGMATCALNLNYPTVRYHDNYTASTSDVKDADNDGKDAR